MATARPQHEFTLFYRWAHLGEAYNNNQTVASMASTITSPVAADLTKLKKDATNAVIQAIMATDPAANRNYHDFVTFLLGNPSYEAECSKEGEKRQYDVAGGVIKLVCNYHLVEASTDIINHIKHLLDESKQQELAQALGPYAESVRQQVKFSTITGIEKHTLTCFRVMPEKGMNDGLIALNTTKSRVLATLAKLADDEKARAELAPDILQVLADSNSVFANVLFDDDKEHLTYLMADKHNPNYQQALLDFCAQKKIYTLYLDVLNVENCTYLLAKLNRGKSQPLGCRSLLLFARATGLNLCIWEKNNNAYHLECRHNYVASTAMDTTHLFYNNQLFTVLVPVGAPYQLDNMQQATLSSFQRILYKDDMIAPLMKQVIIFTESVFDKYIAELRRYLSSPSVFDISDETYYSRLAAHIDVNISFFIEEFMRAWQHGALHDPDKFRLLLQDVNNFGFVHYYAGICQDIARKIAAAWRPYIEFQEEMHQTKLLLQKKHLYRLQLPKNGETMAAIPPAFRALPDDVLLSLAGRANAHDVDEQTGDNLPLLALKHGDQATYNYLVAKCFANIAVCNKRDISASAYTQILKAERMSLVVFNQSNLSKEVLAVRDLVVCDALLINMQVSLQRFKARMSSLLSTSASSFYRQLFTEAPDHLRQKQQEADDYLQVVHAALIKHNVFFIQEIEKIMRHYAAYHGLLTSTYCRAFNLVDNDAAVMMRGYIEQIRREPQRYKYLSGALIKADQASANNELVTQKNIQSPESLIYQQNQLQKQRNEEQSKFIKAEVFIPSTLAKANSGSQKNAQSPRSCSHTIFSSQSDGSLDYADTRLYKPQPVSPP